jgi:magnesium chelatase family protein
MLAAAPSAAVLGIDALDVLVEVHVANGLPQWTIVGMKHPRALYGLLAGTR